MSSHELAHLLRGPFNFLRQEPEEVRRLFPDGTRLLPLPQRIWLESETATPLLGFPMLVTQGLQNLVTALEEYIRCEEESQVAVVRRQSVDPRQLAARWERYRGLFGRALENATLSSYGRQFPGIFWLHHSRAVARLLRDTPKRVARLDSTVGREHGDQIKYKVFYRYLDRVVSLTYDLVNRLAGDTEEVEGELFPALLTRMRDNVLILTEDHISPDLAELASYFSGYLRIDGRELRARLEALAAWQSDELATDRALREAVAYANGEPASESGRELLHRPGWVSLLARRPSWDARRLLRPEQVQVWESLLLKLKEFELLHALRRTVVPLVRQEGALLCADPEVERAWGGKRLVASPTTRPLDFMAPWVVDPQVSRCGMIYDITDFTELISFHRRSTVEQQDQAFRMMFRFQRKINRLAGSHRLKLEKYLGDGAFFSSRDARRMLVVSLHVQRAYAEALREGFPFDRGMRIALNYGHYRLIPIQEGPTGQSDRFEFFGHGIIELTRLVTGKASREVEEIKNLLVAQGYPEPTVNRFFAPLTQQNLDLVDREAHRRQFYAYINSNGTLVNEGIVITRTFLERLQQEGRLELRRWRDGDTAWVVTTVDDGTSAVTVGLRKLGMASLKGLERVAVYEAIDAAAVGRELLDAVHGDDLVGELERGFVEVRSRQLDPQRRTPSPAPAESL